MSLNPIAFTDRVVGSFLRYQLTAYPFADPRLDIQMRELLSLTKTRSTPLLKGPYLTLSRPFQQGCEVKKLIEEKILHPLLRDRIPSSIQHVYQHQEEAIRAIQSGKTTLISTGTGSGKTECFLYPIISRCLDLRDSRAASGISAVLVYPMNSLAEDQLLRLRGLLAGTGISFGMYVGKTPGKKGDVAGKRLSPGSSRADYEKAVEEAQKRESGETVYPAEELCSREEMREAGKQPRILLTNVNQLELLLTRQTDVELFTNARLDFLVFDEAHTFTGAKGAETACLIRRLLRFCEKSPENTTCIATSATIVDPKDPHAAKRFASRFFGVAIDKVTTVAESYVAQTWPLGRTISAAPKNCSEALEQCVLAVDGTEETIRHAFTALSGRTLVKKASFMEDLYQGLSQSEEVYQLAQLLEKPLPLHETTEKLGLALKRETTEEEVLSWLILGAMASQENRPLLRPVVHAFMRGIGGATVTFPGAGDDLKLHFSAELHEENQGLFRLAVSTCTTCGQHYFSSHHRDFHHTSQVLGGGQASGKSRYWEPLEKAKSGLRCVLVDSLVSGEEIPESKVAPVFFCRYCGTFHDQKVTQCGHCGRPDPLVALYSIQTKEENPGVLSRCLTCDANGRRVGAGYREPARPVRTTAVADVHVLAQDMINHLDPQRLLIFCDNRQDAAFQSGWMRDHARRFRLRSLIADELKKGPISVGDLTLTLSQLFEKEESLSHALLPEVWRVAPANAQMNHTKEREKFLRMTILREITMAPRQILGLEPWGRMRVDYKGLTPHLPFIIQASRKLKLSPDEVCDGAASILDYLRRQKVLLDPVHKTFSKFWNHGDSEIQNGYLPDMDPPKGTKMSREASDKDSYVIQWQGTTGSTYIKQAVRKWGVEEDDLSPFLFDLLHFFQEFKWLVPVNLLGAKGKSLPEQSGLSQVDSNLLELVPGQGVWRCKRCSRRMTRKTPKSLCPVYRCSGILEFQSENSDDYNLRLLDQNYELIRPEEHTAMVPHTRREKIENWFKDIKSKAVNTLVCTQTLEMGVDIGALDAVLMRNVPPLPANYWQRVGRAGRRNRMAVNVTYCRDVSHDRSYFLHPEKLLAGRVDAPVFNLSNPLMVRRHIHATIISRLYQKAQNAPSLALILDAAFPKTVRSWLFDGNELRSTLSDLSPLRRSIQDHKQEILDHILDVFSAGWPKEDSEVIEEKLLSSSIDSFVDQLLLVMKRLQRRLNWSHQTVTRLNDLQRQTGTLDPGDEAIRRRCERYIKRIKGEMKRGRSEGEGQDETVTYSVLALEGFLPGYGLERGSIMGSAEIPFWESGNSGELELPRPPLLALREYVPGNLIYANGHRFVSRRYQLQPAEERDVCVLEVTVGKSAIREVDQGHSGTPTSRTLPSLPLTDVDLVHISQISDEEDYRFQMGVAVLGLERSRHSGGKAFLWGSQEIHFLKGQHLRMANVGSNSEIQKRINFGYLICSVCGDSVSPIASDAQKVNFKKGHHERCGNDQRETADEVALHTDLVADVIKFPNLSDQTEAYSVLESIRFAAASTLEMAQEDLQLVVMGHMENDKVTAYLVDPMPGGSGLLEQLIERFPEVKAKAISITEDCPSGCQASCSDCLQTYRNSFYHPHLDRHRAQSFLSCSAGSLTELRTIPILQSHGEVPQDNFAPVNAAERRLRQLLLSAGFPEASWQEQLHLGTGRGTTTPDAIFRPEDEDLRSVALYLDGLSSHLHGNPQTAAKDQIIRTQLREMDWEVLSITAHELHDPEAMRKHFRLLARYLERSDLKEIVVKRNDWFANESAPSKMDSEIFDRSQPIPFALVPESDRKAFRNCLPLFEDLVIAAGTWGAEMGSDLKSFEEAKHWVIPPEGTSIRDGYFIARVTGKSMEPKVPDGSWCLFGPPGIGSRQGKDLLVYHASIQDPDGLGQYTLKRYQSEKRTTDEGWEHSKIILKPINLDYAPIELDDENEGNLAVIAELLKVF